MRRTISGPDEVQRPAPPGGSPTTRLRIPTASDVRAAARSCSSGSGSRCSSPGVVVLIAYWPWVRAHWDRLTRPGSAPERRPSPATPSTGARCARASCPTGRPSARSATWTLVRRTKGEPVPLPDGVVARMQLTPYRVQLAGLRTAPAEYLPLAWEATAGGRLEQPDSGPPGSGRSMSRRPAWPASGPGSRARSRPTPSPASRSRPASARPARGWTRTPTPFRVRLAVEDPRHELKPGLYVTVRLRVPLAQLEAAGRPDRDDWRDRTAAELALRSLPAFAGPLPGLEPLLDMGRPHCRPGEPGGRSPSRPRP